MPDSSSSSIAQPRTGLGMPCSRRSTTIGRRCETTLQRDSGRAA
jgi:hypothetical protein